LISLGVFAPFANAVAQICGIPLIHVDPTPLLPTGHFPAPGWPLQQDIGRLHNRLSGFIMLQVIWQWYRPFVNQFRRRFGLSPDHAGSFYRTLTSNPLLGAYSPHVIPRPPDWPPNVHLTGYWFPDAQVTWQPPADLQAFLDAGDPPIYAGFGSMSGQEPQQVAGIVLEALAKSGQRGLLLTGWGGLQVPSVPERVFVIDTAPHSWLFPRMAAVMHHGGAGTTAEGLRAGVPSVIVPFILDQTFWGKRVKALGVGTELIPRKKLSADNLAQAIHSAVTHPEMRRRAASLGETLRAEDGVGRAVAIIQQVLGV
jgi:sterol 3beta-glucosyltransferase